MISVLRLIEPPLQSKDRWLGFRGPIVDPIALGALEAAKRSAVKVRWRLQNQRGADFFQARLIGFSPEGVVVSLIGFRDAGDTFELPTPIDGKMAPGARVRRPRSRLH